MENHRLVMPGDLNPYGFLFGGTLLAWVDEACWITASIDFPDCHFVTVAMDRVEFRRSVRQGTILSIQSTLERKGHTSVTYAVGVTNRDSGDAVIFATKVTLVRVDANGRKTPLQNREGKG